MIHPEIIGIAAVCAVIALIAGLVHVLPSPAERARRQDDAEHER